MNEVDIAFEEWAENFEQPQAMAAFFAGVRWEREMCKRACTKVLENVTGLNKTKGAYACWCAIEERNYDPATGAI